jgi:hypothetical protein
LIGTKTESQRRTPQTPENPAFSLDAERIEEEKSVARSTFPRIDSYKLTQHGLVTGQKAPSWMAFWQGCRSFLFDPIFLLFPEMTLNTRHSLPRTVSVGFVLAYFANSQGCSGQGSSIRLPFSVRCAADE